MEETNVKELEDMLDDLIWVYEYKIKIKILKYFIKDNYISNGGNSVTPRNLYSLRNT